jgi:N-methylhydantoinase A/oxoprolinase/acetone carboxylase beta subunit
MRTGMPEGAASGLSVTETRLYMQIGDVPEALDRLLVSTSQVATLNRLVARGLVHIAGFTPSDAAHVLGRQGNWNPAVARLGAQLMARRRNAMGQPAAETAEAFSELVLAAVTRRSAEMMFETVFAADGLEEDAPVSHALVQRALDRNGGMARFSISLDRPVIGLGASAHLHYASLPPLIGNACKIAPDADVANALGAVVGQVRVSAEARVSQPEPGVYRINAGEWLEDFGTEDEAMAAAEQAARAMAGELAGRAGTDHARIEVSRDIRDAVIEGERSLVEAFIVATAAGRPRVAS